METRPRVLLWGTGPRATELRAWVLQSGGIPVGEPDADGVLVVGPTAEAGDPPDLPLLDAATATRDEVAAWVRRLAGRDTHTFDDHGSPEAWPRSSY